MCWNSDSYINWLTENGVNVAVTGGLALAGAVTGNVVAAGGALTTGINLLKEVTTASQMPPQVHGNINNGDLMMSLDENCFHIFKMSIRADYAKRIDNYFTRYGYKINEIKKPNINTRKNFNFIQISDDSVLGFGNIPNNYIDNLNAIAKKGVTIWHNHENIGNYDIDNSIV